MRYLFYISCMVLMACSKDEFAAERALLEGKKWKVVAYTVNPFWSHPQTGVQYTNLLLASEACSADDYYRFEPNNQFVQHFGEQRCSAVEPPSSATLYTLTKNQGKTWLSVSGTAFFEVQIEMLTADSMRWVIPNFNMGDGQIRVANMTLAAQP